MSGLESKQMLQVIRFHAARYPLMEPTDAVKLVYQSVFGGGHLIKDTQASLVRLSAERAAANTLPDMPFVEIGCGRSRMHLASYALSTLPDALLNRMFVLSADSPAGGMPQFREALELLSSLAKEGTFRFTEAELADYLRPYVGSGCPMVSHSEMYRRAYRPAYRVVDAAYANLLPAVVSIWRSVASGATGTRIPLSALNGLPPERACALIQALFGMSVVAQAGTSGAPFLLVRP